MSAGQPSSPSHSAVSISNASQPALDAILDSLAPPSAYTPAEAHAFTAGAKALREALRAFRPPGALPTLPLEFAPLPPTLVQLKADKAGVDKKIEAFISAKRAQIDASNQREFLRPRTLAEDANCARVDAVQLNRTVQMKLDIVHNESGPLERSTTRTEAVHGEEKQRGGRASPMPATCANCAFLNGIEDRLGNIQEHLNVSFVSRDHVHALTRIRALEDKINELEGAHPAWAAFHFKQPNRDEDPVLQTDPPQTVVTVDSAGELHTSIIPPSSRSMVTSGAGGPVAAAATGSIARGADTDGVGSGRSAFQFIENPPATRRAPFAQGDVGVELPSTESIEQRIQALRESLEHRQKRLRIL
ncbi:hypothetical protein HDU90_007380 [Geranomyces variabilis]|nr:hypothetical protein HDU90_007380 [Geranomyces variabilis]